MLKMSLSQLKYYTRKYSLSAKEGTKMATWKEDMRYIENKMLCSRSKSNHTNNNIKCEC